MAKSTPRRKQRSAEGLDRGIAPPPHTPGRAIAFKRDHVSTHRIDRDAEFRCQIMRDEGRASAEPFPQDLKSNTRRIEIHAKIRKKMHIAALSCMIRNCQRVFRLCPFVMIGRSLSYIRVAMRLQAEHLCFGFVGLESAPN